MNCFWIFFHHWSKWTNKTLNLWDNGIVVAQRSYQEKICTKCNKIKTRNIF